MENAVKNKFHLIFYVIGLLAVFALACWFLGQIHLIANIMVVSILVTYLIAPAVHFLTERRVPKTVAITIVYLALAAALGFFVAYLLPIVKLEFQRLVQNIGPMAINLQQMANKWAWVLHGYLPDNLKGLFDPSKVTFPELARYLSTSSPDIASNAMPGVVSGVRSAATILTGAILVPLIVFYILMDASAYKESFISCLPKAWRANAVDLLRRIDYVLGGFIRGQLIVCVTIGFFVGLSLWILGVDYAVLIGIFSGVIDIIPYVGVAISYIPAFIIALLNEGPLYAIFTIVILQAVHWLEGHIIVPVAVGHSVKLPPLTVMIALVAGAELGGIIGMLVAIPLTAILRVLIEFYVEKHPAFGPLTPEDLQAPATPYPPVATPPKSPKESVQELVDQVQGTVHTVTNNRLVQHLKKRYQDSQESLKTLSHKAKGSFNLEKGSSKKKRSKNKGE